MVAITAILCNHQYPIARTSAEHSLSALAHAGIFIQIEQLTCLQPTDWDGAEPQGPDFYLFVLDHEQITPHVAGLLTRGIPSDVEVVASSIGHGHHSYWRPVLFRPSALKEEWSFVLPLLREDPEIGLCALLGKAGSNHILRSRDPLVAPSNRAVNPHRAQFLQSLCMPHEPKHYSSPRPSIAIMMANYNMESLMSRALGSIAAQYTLPSEVLLVDDGSTDDSRQKMSAFACNRPHVVLATSENVGKARALNSLIPYVKSDYVLELDADDWIDPSAVAIIQDWLQHLPEGVGLLYGNLRKWRRATQGQYHCLGIARGSQIQNAPDVLKYSWPLGPRIYRTDVLRSIGGIPTTFDDGRLYEDVLAVRQVLSIAKVHYADFTVYNYVRHTNNITFRNASRWNTFLDRLK